MKYGTRDDRAELIGRTLRIFRDGFEPLAWQARRLDERAYLRLQSGDDDRLTAEDFVRGQRSAPRVKPDRSMLEDPHKIIRLLLESPAIRAAILDGNDLWSAQLETLRVARNRWAHCRPLSARLVDEALDSAEQLLRAADRLKASEAAEQIMKLRTPREHAIVAFPTGPRPAA